MLIKNKQTQKNNKYLTIVKKIIKEKIGDFKEIDIELGNDRISIILCKYSIGSDFIIDGEHFIMYDKNCFYSTPFSSDDKRNDGYKFDNEDMFESYVRMNIDKIVIPQIKEFYKRGNFKKLPTLLEDNSLKLDFSKLTKEWLITEFYNISDDIMNGETMENVKIKKSKNLLNITFDVECHPYGLHRNNTISINDKGYIKIDLDDTPIEGCGIETELSKRITKLITIK